MKISIELKLNQLETALKYLTPSDNWEPQKYNHFVEMVEENIINLRQIIQELEQEKKSGSTLLHLASTLLEKYLSLQKEYYS